MAHRQAGYARARRRLKIESAMFKQFSYDGLPLEIKRLGWHGAPGPVVPVRRITWVALFSVKVSVNPGTIACIDILGQLMGCMPVALFIVPQGLEQEAQMRRRMLAD